MVKGCKVVRNKIVTHWQAVVKSAVQNTYKPCRSRKCIRWHIPVHAIFAVFHLLFLLLVLFRPSFTSRTPNKDQKRGTPPHSARLSPITRRHSWALRQALLCMLLASAHKKWYILDGFPCFKHHSIALVLHYNIRLEERSFSIERFQSYTLLKIQYKNCYFTV